MRALLLSAALLIPAPSVFAATVLEDDFSSYGSSTVLNAADTVFSGVWETIDGTVDYLVGSSSFGGLCRGSVACVDLDGSTNNAGVFQTVQVFEAGMYKLSFEIFGSSRGDTNAVTVSLGGLSLFESIVSAGSWAVADVLATVGVGGAKLTFSNAGGDNVGALLNSVGLVKVEDGGGVPAIPLPAGAPLLLGGLALLGLMKRRFGLAG